MALPKKKKGWRKITIDGKIYRWKFSADETSGWLTVRLDESGSPNFRIDLPGISDPWLRFQDGQTLEFTSITPKIVAEAIRTSDIAT